MAPWLLLSRVPAAHRKYRSGRHGRICNAPTNRNIHHDPTTTATSFVPSPSTLHTPRGTTHPQLG
eukprot:1450367-Ditylum_brightwellii.AAC.1